jgi:hypothetical protein
MWRRLYLLLVVVRLYFALSPSYIHPDEHFQGPEVIAGTPIERSLCFIRYGRCISSTMIMLSSCSMTFTNEYPQARSSVTRPTKHGSSLANILFEALSLYGSSMARP